MFGTSSRLMPYATHVKRTGWLGNATSDALDGFDGYAGNYSAVEHHARGTVVGAVASASWARQGVKLLVNGISVNDFGDTRSPVLMIASFAVGTQACDPNVRQAVPIPPRLRIRDMCPMYARAALG